MPRKNERARKSFHKRLNKFRVAKILGVKPRDLTINLGYVRGGVNYGNSS